MWSFHRPPRFLLIVGDEGALLTDAAEAKEIFAKTRDAEARRQIQTRLAQNPRAGVTVLVNNAAQEFRVETLPPLNFLDRGKLIQRRLQQAFPQAFALAYRALDSTHTLLASVQPNGLLNSWCASLPKNKLRFGCLPIEGASLMTALQPSASQGWVMLLAQFKTGGLRQIILCDGQLVFTRQTPTILPDAPLQTITASLQRVIEDTRGYLARFGLKEATPLTIVCIFGQALQIAAAGLPGAQNISCFSPRQAAEKLRLANIPAELDDDADMVFSGWITARKKLWLPLVKTTTSDDERNQQVVEFAKWGMRAAGLVMLAALAVTGWNLKSLVVQAYANQREAEDIATMRQQLALQQATLAPAAKPLGRLRAALERQRIFTEPQPDPQIVLKKLGEELQGKARVTRLEWRDNGTLDIDINLLFSTDLSATDHEAVVKDFKSLMGQMSAGLPDYNFEVARYPFPTLPEDVLTNVGSAPAKELPTASLLIRRRT